jgi:transposase
MTIIAESYEYVVGVDTHARNHVVAVVKTRTGKLLRHDEFPTSKTGINRIVTWIGKHAPGTVMVAVEGTGSYGAVLTLVLGQCGVPVIEAEPIPLSRRRGRGKTDVWDAEHIARAVLGVETNQVRHPRSREGIPAALRVLLTVREQLNKEYVAMVNMVTALVRTTDLGVDARRKLSKTMIAHMSGWQMNNNDPIEVFIARQQVIATAQRILACDQHREQNKADIDQLVRVSDGSHLLNRKGIGPVCAAIMIVGWSHHGRIRSEAGFAALSGVHPIPASSGNTIRHRLTRAGDRQMNKALSIIVTTRKHTDQQTKTYIAKRVSEGKTVKEATRILKRYIARRIYRDLNNPTHPA